MSIIGKRQHIAVRVPPGADEIIRIEVVAHAETFLQSEHVVASRQGRGHGRRGIVSAVRQSDINQALIAHLDVYGIVDQLIHRPSGRQRSRHPSPRAQIVFQQIGGDQAIDRQCCGIGGLPPAQGQVRIAVDRSPDVVVVRPAMTQAAIAGALRRIVIPDKANPARLLVAQFQIHVLEKIIPGRQIDRLDALRPCNIGGRQLHVGNRRLILDRAALNGALVGAVSPFVAALDEHPGGDPIVHDIAHARPLCERDRRIFGHNHRHVCPGDETIQPSQFLRGVID